MLDQFIHNKRYWAIAGTLVLLMICYQLAIKVTIDAWSDNQRLKANLSGVTDFAFQPTLVKRQGKNLDLILNRYQSDSTALREATITRISSLAGKENVKLSEVPVEDPAFHTDQFVIERLKFEGGFKDLLKALNQLELTNGIGMIRSVNIKSPDRKDPEAKSAPISMEILTENNK